MPEIERLQGLLDAEKAAHTRTLDNAARRLVASNNEIAELRERLENANIALTLAKGQAAQLENERNAARVAHVSALAQLTKARRLIDAACVAHDVLGDAVRRLPVVDYSQTIKTLETRGVAFAYPAWRSFLAETKPISAEATETA
jgi:chromosome segregation ATPase